MRVTQIDHVELEVPDRYAAASWYHTILGFEICREYESWAGATYGPLMISTDGGETKLALFEGQSKGGRLATVTSAGARSGVEGSRFNARLET
jgi:catechol 2,3-dioxygenase-like lactoylglutathione lyase family enzyme